MSNLATILSDSATSNPDGIAIRMDDVELSYGALDRLSKQIAGLLTSRGVQPGDRVALISPNLPQMPAIYYGILRFGAVVVPLNPLLKAREVEYHLANAGTHLAFAWEGVLAEVEPGAKAAGTDVIAVDAGLMQALAAAEPLEGIADTAPEDTAVILYTSGTTGRPKGAELTHQNLLSNTQVSCELFSISKDDVLFGGLPFFHIFGQTCALNASVMSGAMLTILPKFDPIRALEVMQRDRVTIFAGVPTMYIALLRTLAAGDNRNKYDVGSLRLAASGGSAMPLEVLHEFEKLFAATLLEGYGLSETSPVVLQPAGWNPQARFHRHRGPGCPAAGAG